MNLFGIALIIIIIPLIVQMFFGSLSIKNKITFPFEFITLLNCIGQFIFIYLALKIIEIDAQNQNIRCGMPQASLFFAGLISLIILLVIIVIQILIRRKLRNENK